MKTIWRGAVLAGTAGLMALSGAGAAGASTVPGGPKVTPVRNTAITKLTSRPVSGNGGTWADENVTRTLTVTLTGRTTKNGRTVTYHYSATLKDTGTFTTIKGARTPDQGGKYARDKIAAKVTGTVSGTETFTFTTSKPVSTKANLGVAKTENGAPRTAAQNNTAWYKGAFPAGTVFGAVTGKWSWTYTYQPPAKPHGKKPAAQKWTDSSTNGNGNKVADGNITG